MLPDRTVWNPLRQAIVESSGFQEWLDGRHVPTQSDAIDVLVHEYLEQTLSTLAY